MRKGNIEMSKELISKTLSFYKKIIADYRVNYAEKYPLSPIWSEENMRIMRDILSTSKDAVEAVHRLQAYWFMQVPPKTITDLAVDWHLNSLLKSGLDFFDLPLYIQESDYAPPETLTVRNDRKLRPDFFRHLGTVLRIDKNCKLANSNYKIFEVGGGTGNLARLIRLLAPSCHYVIVDLPETICFSYMYLRLNFPNKKTLFVTGKTDILNNILEDYDFIFAPISYAEDLLIAEYDMFINTASLGEMRNEMIRYWMNFVQEKMNPKFIVSVNRYLNTIIPGEHDWRLNENLCSLLYDEKWEMIDWELDPEFMRRPYASKAARHLLIIGKRLFSIAKDKQIKMSKQLYEEAKLGSWRDFPVAMTCQDHVLVNDMTKDGILFRIWESIRLNRNKDNVNLMLEYLETLLRRDDREFEEVFFYEDLLYNLHQKEPDENSDEVVKWLAERRKNRPTLPPKLIEESYKGFGIVLYKDRYYAMAHTLGPVDLTQVDEVTLAQYQARGQCIIGNSLEQVKQSICCIQD